MKTKLFEANVIYEISEWGIGFQVGKTYYSEWKFFVSLDFLCFLFVVWFGRKKESENKRTLKAIRSLFDKKDRLEKIIADQKDITWHI